MHLAPISTHNSTLSFIHTTRRVKDAIIQFTNYILKPSLNMRSFVIHTRERHGWA